MYDQSDTLLLADVFDNFRNICLEIYELDPAHFLSALGLAWQAALKMTKVKSDLLTDIDTLLMVEKGIRGGISLYLSIRKANNKYMKDYDKNKESLYTLERLIDVPPLIMFSIFFHPGHSYSTPPPPLTY